MLTTLRVRDAEAHELLDETTLDDNALRRNLADIRHINFLLGWTRFTVCAVARYVRANRLVSFSLLDVAGGSADMPLAVARWAAHAGVSARIVSTDLSPQIVRVASQQIERARRSGVSGANVSVSAERQDALALTYPPGSFDIALCTLALHHFAPDDAVELLRNMARVARQVFVFDVERSMLAYIGAVLLTRLAFMNYMTRHDAPTSVRRAYSAPELRTLAREAGLADARVWVGFPFRLALEARGQQA